MRRVVITGVGLLTPIGEGKDRFWEALIGGVSGIREVKSFDPSEYPARIGAEVPDFRPERSLSGLPWEGMGRASQLAVAAGMAAWNDSGLGSQGPPPHRVGVSMGTTSGEPLQVEQCNDIRAREGELDRVPADVFLRYPCGNLAFHLADALELQGPCRIIPTACAAGNYAIGDACDLIRCGRASAMLAGGADAFSRIPYMGFARLGAIAPELCQPFDRNRKGMVPGEGAAVVVLEELESAQTRRAPIYAEILGYGISCDAHHMTAAHPQGDGALRAMLQAIEESGCSVDDIDYVSAHGTGTPTNDRVESAAHHRLFGSRVCNVPISSIKSMLGHTMGAASAIEAVACALALRTGQIPPTINFRDPDPECDVDCVPNQARRIDPRIVLSNAYAFGGNNASLCMGRFGE